MKRALLSIVAAFLFATVAQAQTLPVCNWGDMLYRSSTGYSCVPYANTAGKFLQENGPSAAPTWTFQAPQDFLLPTQATNTVLGNVTGGNASPTAINPTQFLDVVAYDSLKPQADPGTILYRGVGALGWQKLPPGVSGQALITGGLVNPPFWGSAGTGTVTSIALTAPSELTVTGSPIINAGTLGLSWASQSANLILASPNAGSGTPAFRALVDADLTAINESGQLDKIGTTRGSLLYRGASGWAILAPGTASRVLTSNGAGADPSWGTAGSGTISSITAGAGLSASPNPIVTTGTVSLDLTNANIWTASQTINKNAAALPTPITGTLLQVGSADGVVSRVAADSFAAASFFSARRANGTAAAPSALAADNQIGAFNFHGYGATAYGSVQASLGGFAAQTWTDANQGTYLDISTTPNNSTTLTKVARFENDGGITVPNTVTGGSKGAGTINATNLYVAGNAVLNTGAVVTPAQGGTGSAFFSVAGPTALRVYTFPDAATTIVGLATAQTLSNKTFDTAAPNTLKVNGNTLTAAAGSATVTIPNATDQLVGKATTDTLTNKTYDTAGTGNSFLINGVAVTANTGTGAVARAAAPTFTTPALGAATATSINKVAITAPATASTLTIADGKTLTVNQTITFAAGADGLTLNIGSAGGTLGTAAFQNTGTSGANVPLLNGTNTASGVNTFSNTTDATNTTTAGLVGSGGLAIAKSSFFGDKLTVTKNTGTLPTPATGTVAQFAAADATATRIEIQAFGVNNTDSPGLFYRAARGTAASPTASQSGDFIGYFAGFGYGATGYSSAPQAAILMYVNQNWTDSAQGTAMDFATALNGTTTRATKMTIDNKGHIGFTNTAPTISSCGTSPSTARGTDTAGEVTEGTTATGCTITFANSGYTAAPYCVVGLQTQQVAFSYSISTTAITVTNTSASGDKINWVCHGL